MAWKFGKYDIKVTCGNCGKECVVRIKRGITVVEATKSSVLICDNCGCFIDAKEYKTQWLE